MQTKARSLPTYENGGAVGLHAHSIVDKRWRHCLKIILVLLLLWALSHHIWPRPSQTDYSNRLIPLKHIPSRLDAFQACSIDNLLNETNLDFLSTAHPIQLSEFASRRDRLAQALAADGIDAFVGEPGYTFQYYANVCYCHSFISVF